MNSLDTNKSWENTKDFKIEKLKDFGKNAWNQDVYLINYKGFTDVTVKENFDYFIKGCETTPFKNIKD